MRQVKYKGGERHIGRFGVVKKGSILEVNEGEWDDIADNPEFAVISSTVSETDSKLGANILPFGTPIYDLRTVQWESPRLFQSLMARESRQRLNRMIQAMTMLGAVVEICGDGADKMYLADAIVSSAKNMGWTALDQNTRMSLPAVKADGNGGVVIPVGASGLDSRILATPSTTERITSSNVAKEASEDEQPVEPKPKKKKLKTLPTKRVRSRAATA